MALYTKFFEAINEHRNVQRICYVIACFSYLLDGFLNTVIVPIVPLRLEDEITVPRDSICNGTKGAKANESIDQKLLDVSCDNDNLVFALNSTTELATGLLFASKAIFQVILVPVAGTVIDRFMYELPLLFGVCMQLIATIVYCVHDSYWFMFCARSVQGIGSAFTDPAAVGLVTEFYPGDAERVTIICVLTAFISSSNVLGPLFGGFLDEYVSSWMPFGVLAVGLFIEMLLILVIIYPVRKQRADELKNNLNTTNLEATPIYKLIIDPYVLLCCGGMFISMITLVALESTIGIWMRIKFHSSETEIGFVLAPSFISFLIAIFLTMFMSKKYPSKQWLLATVCLAVEGVTCLLIPFSPSYGLLIVVLMIFVFNVAVTEIIVYATFPRIVDIRYVPVYGSIYSIAMFSYNICYALAPLFGNAIIAASSFTTMIVINALMKILYAPLLIFLKNLYDVEPSSGEKQHLVTGAVKKDFNQTAETSGNVNRTFVDDCTN